MLTARRLLPSRLQATLWGDRERWGRTPDHADPSWQEWMTCARSFYENTQREGIGWRVNRGGYRILERVSMRGRRVLEIGAGDLRHDVYWDGPPASYSVFDVSSAMLEMTRQRLQALGIPGDLRLVEPGCVLPPTSETFDLILAFYSLEHIHPLDRYLAGLASRLEPGGLLVGAVPTEGGLAWAFGRQLTSRRWLRQHTSIDFEKLIAWEHPNFGDTVIGALDEVLTRESLDYWPTPIPLLDLNLLLRFIYRKREAVR